MGVSGISQSSGTGRGWQGSKERAAVRVWKELPEEKRCLPEDQGLVSASVPQAGAGQGRLPGSSAGRSKGGRGGGRGWVTRCIPCPRPCPEHGLQAAGKCSLDSAAGQLQGRVLSRRRRPDAGSHQQRCWSNASTNDTPAIIKTANATC